MMLLWDSSCLTHTGSDTVSIVTRFTLTRIISYCVTTYSICVTIISIGFAFIYICISRKTNDNKLNKHCFYVGCMSCYTKYHKYNSILHIYSHF